MDPEGVIGLLVKKFEVGLEHDLWGQSVEAGESYSSLVKDLQQYSSVENVIFTDEHKKILARIALCLELRCHTFQVPGCVGGIYLADMQKAEEILKNLLEQTPKNFPVKLTAAHLSRWRTYHLRLQEQINEGNTRQYGTLLPKPLFLDGMHMLTIRIQKIGLKDFIRYIDPFITVSVKDSQGQDLVGLQDTPLSKCREDSYILFNVDVYIQKSLANFPPDFAIFFEFKHYKPRKSYTSTKCWTFLEKEEVKEGPVFLELYKKPLDCQRKRINLLTVKPLYLHLKLTVDI